MIEIDSILYLAIKCYVYMNLIQTAIFFFIYVYFTKIRTVLLQIRRHAREHTHTHTHTHTYTQVPSTQKVFEIVK